MIETENHIHRIDRNFYLGKWCTRGDLEMFKKRMVEKKIELYEGSYLFVKAVYEY